MNEPNKKSELMKTKGYLYLIIAQVISSFGHWIDMLAIITLVAVKWNSSPIAVSAVSLMYVAPIVLFGPIAGTLSDKTERRTIMLITNLSVAVIVLGVSFSTELWQVLVLLFIRSSLTSLFTPAKNGKLKEIVRKEDLQAAMGISAIIDNGSKIIGPLLSGFFVASIGIQWAFYINAITLIIASMFLLGIPTFSRTGEKQLSVKELLNIKNIYSDLKQGFSFLKTMPIILVSIVITTITIIFMQFTDTQIMILFREVFTQPENVAGFSMAANGSGMFIAATILTKRKIVSVFNYMLIGTLGLGFSVVLIPLISNLPSTLLMILYPIIFLVLGFSVGCSVIPLSIIAQKETPVHMTGRVFGTINSMTTLGTLIGIVSGGLLTQTFGIYFAFIMSGIGLILGGFIIIFIKKPLERRELSVSKSINSIQRGT